MAGQSIFVTDHDVLFINLLADLLRAAGYTQVFTLAGASPFEALRQAMPDVIVVDINVADPGPCWRTLDLLRIDPVMRATPLIVSIQEYGTVAHNVAALQAMGCYVLLKPFDQAMLLATMHMVIGPPSDQDRYHGTA